MRSFEVAFAIIYLSFIQHRFKLSIKQVSYDSLKTLLSSRTAKNGIILKFTEEQRSRYRDGKKGFLHDYSNTLIDRRMVQTLHDGKSIGVWA